VKGLRFECTQCGKCCTNHADYAHVYLADREVTALARLLGLPVEEFERKYTLIDEDGWTQLKTEAGRCMFLGADGGCGVYGARPTQCRTFPFWRDFVEQGKWTDEVREICEGIGRGRVYTHGEAERLMIQMEESDLED
jgi:Fe-S-cluster containining protein